MPVHDSFGSSTRRSGSILIVCFFVLVLLSMFTLTVGYTMRQKFQVLSRLDTRQKLRLVGDAGVQKAIYALLKSREHPSSYDALNQSWSRNESEFKEVEVGDGQFSVFHAPAPVRGVAISPAGIEYGLIDEERKINLNLAKSPEVLRRLFREAAALNEDEASALADAILDWKDEDDDTSLLGAERRYYKGLNPSYIPRNGKFATLAELEWVKGMKPEVFAKIRPYITLDSSGQVNLNTAPKAVLVALGFSPDLCEKIMTYRGGIDTLEGTGDDQAFDDLSAAAQLLANESYLDNNDRSDLEEVIQKGLLTVKSQTFTAQVLAKLNHRTQSLQVTAVFDDKGVIKRWEETFAVS